MKTIKLAIVCAAVLAAAPAALRATELRAPGTPEVSTGTAAGTAEAAPEPQAPRTVGLVRGYRGTTLAVGGDQLLYVKKGDRVDVLVTFDAKMEDKDKVERKEKVTASILQNVVVINVRKAEKVDETGAVELLLNPVEAQYAALAVAQGNIHITVRAPGDVELKPMEIATFRKLIQ